MSRPTTFYKAEVEASMSKLKTESNITRPSGHNFGLGVKANVLASARPECQGRLETEDNFTRPRYF